MINLEIFESFGEDHFRSTSWSRKLGKRVITVTIREVLRFLNRRGVEPITVPIRELLPISIHRKGDFSDESHRRALESHLNYPIIVAVKDGRFHMILDGNHRLLKSRILGFETIKVRILDLDRCPKKFKFVFK